MKRQGFTLIELLVVIAIIGLLSTLAVIALGSARVKARDSKRLADLKQTQTALELYYTDKNDYPAGNGIALGAADYACLNGSGFVTAANCGTSPYMGQIPVDPKSGNYTYTYSSSSYTVNATLEGEVNGLGPGAIKLTPSGISE